MSTVILGGGIIGLSTAYYLSLQQPEKASSGQIQVVDNASSLLLSASGYAGGFLAKDWFSPAVSSLGALSFRLHRELAQKHDGRKKWGYSASTAYSLSVDKTGVSSKQIDQRSDDGEDWLEEGTSRAQVATHGSNDIPTDPSSPRDEMLNEDGSPAWITKQEGGTLEPISDEASCAQVEPRHLSEWLYEQCRDRGVIFHLNTEPLSLTKDSEGRISGIVVRTKNGDKRNDDAEDEQTIPATNIILSAGAWTPSLFRLLFPQSKTQIGISPLAGYSIVVRSPRYSRPIFLNPENSTLDSSTSNPSYKTKNEDENRICHSVFCGPGPNWPTYAPEAIARTTRDGRPEIYVAGLNDEEMSLPRTADGVKEKMDPGMMQDLRRTTIYLTGLSSSSLPSSSKTSGSHKKNNTNTNIKVEAELHSNTTIKNDIEIVREGLCFRPVSNSGRPVVMRLSSKQLGPGVKINGEGGGGGGGGGGGVYIAAGHGPWGISLGLGTGLVVAEMIQGKKTSARIEGLGIR